MSKEDPDKGKTFSVEVHEKMGLAESHPGGESPKKPEMTREEALKYLLERKVFLSMKYIKPHNKISRHVTDKDLPRVLEDAKILHEMCMVGRGDYNTAFAIAHTQIEEKDPLRFYVTIKGQIIINPVIFNHTKQFIDKREGCMSFPENPMIPLTRFHKIQMRYQTLSYKTREGNNVTGLALTEEVTSDYSGEDAEVCQHEVAHLLGSNIYLNSHSAYDCIEK